MNIVHIIDYFSPQLGYQETYLAKEQMRLGHNVTVLTSDRYFPFPNYHQTIEPILGERIVGCGKSMEEGIQTNRLPVFFEIFTRCFLIGLINELISLHPDAIHIHSASSLNTLRIACFRKFFPHARIICDDHSHYSVITDHWSKKIFYRLFRTFFSGIISDNIDKFVAITEETKKIMKEILGIRGDISVIELGADIDLFKFDLKKRNILRKKYHVSKRDFLILYAGKIIPQKGIDVLIDAYKKLKKDNIKLCIIGNGESRYIQMMQRELLDDKRDVIWVPMVRPQDLPAYYSMADIGVWPKQESISMIEASSCELPIIIKKSKSMNLRVSNNNGLLYKEGDSQDLTEKILFMIDHREKNKDMRKKSRLLVEKQFSWKAITKAYVSLYSNTII